MNCNKNNVIKVKKVYKNDDVSRLRFFFISTRVVDINGEAWMLFITLLSCCSLHIIPPSSHRKLFAGHRFSTHFLHTQIFILALSARSEE